MRPEWTFQNLIIWKKKTSAIPGLKRFGKHYQVIAFATKGKTPRVFHRLRIDPPLPADYRHARENGMFVTDVWDDIRELTAGYFAGDEALRDAEGNRLHKQQTPIQLPPPDYPFFYKSGRHRPRSVRRLRDNTCCRRTIKAPLDRNRTRFT